MRNILHIDMNSYFASCEQAINPKLKEKPLIVGGDPKKRRGIVLAASYDAKAYGVKTTMPIWQAMNCCPQAEVIQPTHHLYSSMSKQVMAIFDEYTPLKEQLSIDEAFLDMTGSEHLFGTIDDVALEIQTRIKKDLDLPSSVGISTNKLLAKMASDYKKPMGITKIYPNTIEEMLWHLPVSELYGVGKKTTIALKNIGITTIGHLAKCPMDILVNIVGKKYAMQLHHYANGIDNRPVNPNNKEDVKSISNEITFPADINDLNELKKETLLLSDSVSWRLRKHLLKGKTVSIKIKYSDFSVITRSKTIESTDITDEIYYTAYTLLRNSIGTKSVRLLGVGVSNFETETHQQLSIFDIQNNRDIHQKNENADKLVDDLRKKFGYDVVKRATLMKTKHKPKT